MSHKSQRKERQRQQKMQEQEHQPQKRVQRRQRERRDRRERRRERREERGTRETIQETSSRIDRGSQTDGSQPFIHPEPQIEQIQEQFQEPQEQLLPVVSDFINHFRFWISLLLAAFCLGFLIGQVVKWRVPRANEALGLAIRVFAAEVVRFVFKLVNILLRSWAHVVSTYAGFLAHLLFLAMLTFLIGLFGQMYVLREDPAEEDDPFEDDPFEDDPFEDVPFEDNPFEDDPFDHEHDSDKSSNDDFHSLTDIWATENAPEMERLDTPDSDYFSGDVVAGPS